MVEQAIRPPSAAEDAMRPPSAAEGKRLPTASGTKIPTAMGQALPGGQKLPNVAGPSRHLEDKASLVVSDHDSYWFYWDKWRIQHGPVDAAELSSLFDAGNVNRNTKIW